MVNNYGQPQLPSTAARVYGKPGEGDCTAQYLDRDGKVQTTHSGCPRPKSHSKAEVTAPGGEDGNEVIEVSAKTWPGATRNGIDMIAGGCVCRTERRLRLRSPRASPRLQAVRRHADRFIGENRTLEIHMDKLCVMARVTLIDALSQHGHGGVPRCLSRPALEASSAGTSVLRRPRIRDTRAALKHLKGASCMCQPPSHPTQSWPSRWPMVARATNCPPTRDRSSWPKTNPRQTAERIVEEVPHCAFTKRMPMRPTRGLLQWCQQVAASFIVDVVCQGSY